MDKSIFGIILTSGDTLVCEIEQIFSEQEEPNCSLINPYKVLEDNSLLKWPSVSDQNIVEIHSRNIITILVPKEEIMNKYLELTAE
jgi:hypothetical protein